MHTTAVGRRGKAGRMISGFCYLAFLCGCVSCGKQADKTEPSVTNRVTRSKSSPELELPRGIDRASLRKPPATQGVRRHSSGVRAERMHSADVLVGEEQAKVQGSAPQIPPATPVGEAEKKLRPEEFLVALRSAVGMGDANAIRSVLERAPQDAALADTLKGMMNAPGTDAAMQRYAAEALVRIGTGESVQYVLGQLLVAYRSGDSDRANGLLAALETPTTADGMKVLFDFLLGRGNFARTQEAVPAEAMAATRKALLAASDREAVGNLAAKLYLDPQVMTNNVAMWELFDGVSHPLMLAQLATRAYQENLPDNAAQFLDRLSQSDDQSVVQAIVQMVPNQSVPLDDAAMALHDWSLVHQQAATPGLYIEYMTDRNLPPEQRSVAAFGLAGSSNPEYAKQALEKALGLETDPVVRTNLQTALTILNKDRLQK
jgi:hypothetical protein